MMSPVVSKFLNLNPEIKYTKIDIDESPEIAKHYNVKGVPTFIGLENNVIINRIIGAVPLSKLEGILKDND